MISGMEMGANQVDMHCFACNGYIEGKQMMKSFPTNKKTCATKIFKLMHFDVCGRMKTLEEQGIFLTFMGVFAKGHK